MADVRPDIDLAALQRPPAPASVARPRRSKLRIYVPLVIVVGFLAILVVNVGDLWSSSVAVTVVRPKPRDESGGGAPQGAVLFQAAGWAEPDPFPVLVSALTEGVVSEVLVQESVRVQAGDPVARLIDADAKIALLAAEAEQDEALAEQNRAHALLPIAEEEFAAALDVSKALASARADAEGRRADAEGRRQAVLKGESALRIAEEELAVQRYLAENKASGPRQVDLAAAKVDFARADLEILKADAALAAAEHAKAQAEQTRAEKDAGLRTKDRTALEDRRAAAALVDAAVAKAKARVQESKLRLERTTVRAPVAGVVLQRLAVPGTRLTDSGGGVCTLYSPEQMRVRVDVPQAEVVKVSAGQKAEILAESRGGRPYAGEVIRVVQQADIQKVTLQVHVRVIDSDALLRPEMLVQVRFFATGAPAAAGVSSTPAEIVLVPRRLLDKEQVIWVVDAESRKARRRSVEVGQQLGEWVEILSGINLSDKLIDRGRERLKDGAKIVIEGES